MENNPTQDKLSWLYKAGFFVILMLPALIMPPYFFPADWGKSVVFRSITATLLFLFLWRALHNKQKFSGETLKFLIKNKIAWALTALFLVFLLASIFSVDPRFSFWGSPYRGGGFVTFAFYFAFVFLAAALFKKEDWKKAWIVSIFAGILVSLLAIIQFYGLLENLFVSVASRPSSTMGNPILLGIYLLLLFFLTLSFAIKEPFDSAQGKFKKIFYGVAGLIFLFAILITGSRAVYFGIIAGVLYFLLFYPKKLKVLKIISGLILFLVFLIVLFVNISAWRPEVLQSNRVFQAIETRLSVKKALNDERYKAWQTAFEGILNRPILGWGLENFSVAFDKNYDPKITPAPWWDKAHNIFLDTGTQAGVLGFLAYISLFIILFWQLHKNKNDENSITVTAIQATLVGYLIANLFSFDSFSTYFIFFLLIAYTLHLTNNRSEDPQKSVIISMNPWMRRTVLSVLSLALVVFIYQYNLLPFHINGKINTALDLANHKNCSKAMDIFEKTLPSRSFLDSYLAMQYVEFTKTCAYFYPENNLTYIKRDFEVLKETVKIQPLYTRYWISLGNFATSLSANENNPDTKNDLLKQANYYFSRAQQLSPKHQEITIGQAKMEIVAGNYGSAENYSKKCVEINPDLSDCYWYLALSQIYLKNNAEAQKNLQIAASKGIDMNAEEILKQMANGYGYLSDWKNLSLIYEKLILVKPNNAQYHSSLAYFYSKIGEYAKARQEALMVLKLSPESKPNIDEFLKTLPH